MTMILFLNYAGVFVFAATGALAASRRQLDIIGYIFLANVTGIGGGTIRDLVLGDSPVFWVRDPVYLMVGTAAALVVYITANRIESRYRMLLWLDAAGMAAYSVMGASKGLDLGFSATIAIVTGIFTATFGGIMRDVIAGEPSVLMRREIYITAALAGSCSYVLLAHFDVADLLSSVVAAGIAFIIRGGALYYGWMMPARKTRPGRTEEQLKRDGIVRSD